MRQRVYQWTPRYFTSFVDNVLYAISVVYLWLRSWVTTRCLSSWRALPSAREEKKCTSDTIHFRNNFFAKESAGDRRRRSNRPTILAGGPSKTNSQPSGETSLATKEVGEHLKKKMYMSLCGAICINSKILHIFSRQRIFWDFGGMFLWLKAERTAFRK